jgi:2-polyprenyl-3-methyl-5-hydroxy-6-metoxy-1,4-benzoquinol methylase
MKLSKQQTLTKQFFNDVAKEWFERTYDPKEEFLRYPVNGARKDVAMHEIRLLRKSGSVLDLGCGTGQMVIELRKLGYEASGIDVAQNMIEEAKATFKKSGASGDPKKFFSTGDCLNLSKGKTYDVVTGLGLLEYLEGDTDLFTNLKKVVRPGGYAIVECRNQLFNLFSGNQYTEQEAKAGALARLVKEFPTIEKYSPFSNDHIPEIQAQVTEATQQFLKGIHEKKAWRAPMKRQYTPFPKGMVRQQHTPAQFERSAARFGFALQHVVYYHLHPYPPIYEKVFPKIYNKLSLLMGPLGYTSLGAVLGSAFVSVLKREK